MKTHTDNAGITPHFSTSGSQPHSVDYFSLRAQLKAKPVPIVDVRSPMEFAQGSIPHSINIPLFSDEERAKVGTLYKQEGSLAAIQEGLAIFAENCVTFQKKVEAAVEEEATMLLYCWRGGMRSQSVALWLRKQGYNVWRLEGGYKRYRNDVLNTLERMAQHPMLVLNGCTGSGKTALLRKVSSQFPCVDFEGLAQHRGSALGDINLPEQPRTQQNFENLMAEAYLEVAHHPRILVEIENFIGPVALTLGIRKQLASSPMVLVSRELADRVRLLVEEYATDWDESKDALFAERVRMFEKHLSAEKRAELVQAAKERRFAWLAEELLKIRYDRLYEKSIRRIENQIVARFNLTFEEDKAIDFLRQYLC